MIINANSLDYLKQLGSNSIDSVVTDPPYGLSFMGKSWDYDVPQVELWQEVFRVLKPGGYLLAFAGTRTQHRMAVNIEDAGFEIRDMIAWVYGSGFPKSLNIGKAVDKLQGNEREITGYAKSNPDLRDVGRLSKEAVGIDKLSFGQAQGAKRQQTPIDKGNSPYEGWGTALKPALEPITVARKPISEKNIAQNVLKWGTGGLNIDGCRVGTETMTEGRAKQNTDGRYAWNTGEDTSKPLDNPAQHTGRFPANFIHDGSDEVTELLGEPARFFYCAKASKAERNKGLEDFEEKRAGAMEFRNRESEKGQFEGKPQFSQNTHPTVKPLKLMQYLVRLVTPKDGTVLDPFNGSGTTGIAAKLEGFNYIGIELDPEYVAISEARIAAWQADPQGVLL